MSLWEMLSVYASDFVRLGMLLRVIQHSQPTTAKARKQVVSPGDFKTVMRRLGEVSKLCQDSNLVVSAGVFAATRTRYRKTPPTYAVAKTDFEGLERCLVVEYRNHWLLQLEAGAAKYYEHGPAPFGEAVAKSFGSAAPDIREAHKCYALERYTATVFHLMRVLEKGLGVLAREHGVPFATENWQNVIEGIESKIKELNSLPRGPAKTEELEFQSKAAAEFRYFKDAWRNHVMHGRDPYDKGEAEVVMLHVRQFMQHIASRLSE